MVLLIGIIILFRIQQTNKLLVLKDKPIFNNKNVGVLLELYRTHLNYNTYFKRKASQQKLKQCDSSRFCCM